MGNVPGARMSPEIVAGEIRFYRGDNCKIRFELELEDQDGTPVLLNASGDKISFKLYDRTGANIFGEEITPLTENAFTVDLPVNLLDIGRYTYRIQVTHASVNTTIAYENVMIVR